MWRAKGNPNPYKDLDKFCTHIPTCPRKVLILAPSTPLGLRA